MAEAEARFTLTADWDAPAIVEEVLSILVAATGELGEDYSLGEPVMQSGTVSCEVRLPRTHLAQLRADVNRVMREKGMLPPVN